MKRDLVSFASWSSEEILEIFRVARALRDRTYAFPLPLHQRSAALVFEKESLRTRVSFEVGTAELGGHPIFLQQEAIGMATRESVHDIAATLSEYCSLIIARTVRHQTCVQLADSARVPVINALTDLVHPCQILADVFTLMDVGRFTPATKLVFVGQGNNIANSWLELAAKFPMHLVCSCPTGYEPHLRIIEDAQVAGKSIIELNADPLEAVRDADVVYTDVWPSKGPLVDEGEQTTDFRPYQVNKSLLRHAKADCLVMHRLPANRGEEITSDVLDGANSLALKQALNRLHVQKGIMAVLLPGIS